MEALKTDMQALTMTIPEILKRHVGLKRSTLQRMCILQEIRAQKVGKLWHVEVKELNRVFLGVRGKQ